MTPAASERLEERHDTRVTIRYWDAPQRSSVRTALVFAGPAFLVAVGYIDPGNWGTDLSAGSRFGFDLLWVLVLADLVAIFLQYLAVKVGAVAGQNLAVVVAQRCTPGKRRLYGMVLMLGMLATEAAECVGIVVAVRILLHCGLMPAIVIGWIVMTAAVAIGTGRVLERLIFTCLAVIMACYIFQMVHAPPAASGVLHGLAPGGLGAGRLLLAIAIVGATVMPHNLLLHSDLVLSRRSPTASPRRLIRIATMETAVALNLALLLNAAILFVAATVFFHSGTTVTTLREGYETLRPILGQSTAWAFAVALLAASLASGITGALAGQIVLDAFWSARVSPVTRRALVTLPPMILLAFGLGELTILVWSQAVLCVVLVLVASSLVSVAGDRSVMGSYAIGRAPRCIGGAILIALVITNIALLGSVIG